MSETAEKIVLQEKRTPRGGRELINGAVFGEGRGQDLDHFAQPPSLLSLASHCKIRISPEGLLCLTSDLVNAITSGGAVFPAFCKQYKPFSECGL